MPSPHLFGNMVQLGYVVTDFDRAAVKFRERYGIDKWKVVPLDPGSASSRIAMAYVGDIIFELVEVDTSVELLDIHRGWLPEDPGEARLNHVAFMLDSLEAWQDNKLGLLVSHAAQMPKSVPMARGKHLYPFRTQQLSLVAVTILGVHPWENSTVPNYKKTILTGWSFSYD